jgi:muramoyltetrapeptide carboxypeptidase
MFPERGRSEPPPPRQAAPQRPGTAFDGAPTVRLREPWQTHGMATYDTASPLGVYAISPSGAVQDTQRAQRAIDNLGRSGFSVRLDRAALKRWQRFGGTDAERAAAFERAARQPAPVVMTTRGGYGMVRLLDRLDWAGLADAGKQWVGLSDFTAFHLAMLAKTGAVTWAGPALLDLDSEDPASVDPVTLGTFGEAMRGELELLGFRMPAGNPSGVEARGTLWGGNLAVLCALIGTPWFPAIRRGILFVEDVNEHPYRIERMLLQLVDAGIVDAQRAVLVGHVNRYALGEHDNGYDLAAALKYVRGRTKTPIITGLPFGHEHPVLTLPHGARVGLATEGRTCWLQLPHSHR